MDIYNRFIFRVHAIKRMFERNITEEDVKHVVINGTIIQEYLDDKPYPSALILGWCKDRPIHVMAASSAQEKIIIIITAYEPDTFEWEIDFKTRRKK